MTDQDTVSATTDSADKVDQSSAKPDGVGTYRRLLRYTFNHRAQFSIAILGLAIFSAADAGFMYLVRFIIDDGFVERDPVAIAILPWIVIGLFAARGGGSFLAKYFMDWVAHRVLNKLRAELFDKLLTLPTAFYSANSSGNLISRLTFNVEQLARAATSSIKTIVQDSLLTVGLLIVMCLNSVKLTLIVLTVGPLIAVIVSFVSKRFRRISKRIQNSMGDVTHVTSEAVEGHQVVKLFGGETFETGRFGDVLAENLKQKMKFTLTEAANNPVIQFIAAIPIAIILWVATQDEMTAGAFASFIGAAASLLKPLRSLTTVNATLQRGIAAADSVFELIDADTELDTGTRLLTDCAGAVGFSDVKFRYTADGEEVLRGVSLNIEPGQTVAVVGRSGSGKSTMMSLVPRFYDVSGGAVTVDGVDVRDYRLDCLRRHIALVSQHIVLFNDTVAANIAYGELGNATEAEIIEAAKSANAWEFIQQLPQGLNTQVGESGMLLSGGQRQRIAIARALLKDAAILILDEATASLDTESERQIQGALESLMAKRTTLVIAHRLSTIEKADCIAVMEQGRLIESGNHAELLAKDGAYAALHKLQFQEAE